MFRSSPKQLARVGGSGRATEDHESDKVMTGWCSHKKRFECEREALGEMEGALVYVSATDPLCNGAEKITHDVKENVETYHTICRKNYEPAKSTLD